VNQRIEHTDPLELLRELPDGLAQMCITRLHGEHAPAATLSALDQTRRVLRTDGTLWLLAHRHEQRLIVGVRELGFVPLPTPGWAGVLRGAPLRLMVFAKGEGGFCEERLFVPQDPRPVTTIRAGRYRRTTPAHAQACGPDPALYRRLFKRCVLAGSAFIACGVCGAPYRPVRSGERGAGIRRPTCPHENPDGRCLVLDPFYDPRSGTGEVAVGIGRSFLGIVPTGKRSGAAES
jgi:hypothetical protein